MKRFVDIPPNLTRLQLDCTFHSQKSQQSWIKWRPVFLHKNPSFQTTFNGQTPQNQLIQYWPNQVKLSKFSQVVKRLGLTSIKPSFFFFEHCSVCLFWGVPSIFLLFLFVQVTVSVSAHRRNMELFETVTFVVEHGRQGRLMGFADPIRMLPFQTNPLHWNSYVQIA